MPTEIFACVVLGLAVNAAVFAAHERANPFTRVRLWIRIAPGWYAGLALRLVALTRRGLARIGVR